jgi:hypothetical protein
MVIVSHSDGSEVETGLRGTGNAVRLLARVLLLKSGWRDVVKFAARFPGGSVPWA